MRHAGSGTDGRSLALICLATGGWAFSFGVGTQGLTLAMDARGWSSTVIGLNTATYYLGIAVAAVFVPALMRRWGNGCPAGGMVVSGAALLLFPCWPAAAPWFALRLLCGMAGALSLVPLETRVSQGSEPAHRSRDFAVYAVALTLGGAAGIGLGLPLYQAWPLLPFLAGGAAALASGLWLWLRLPPPAHLEEETAGTSPRPADHVLSFGSAWVQGFLEGGMLAFLSLYLLALGLSADAAGVLVAASLVGVIVFQVPVGWLADRWGRANVLLGCYAVITVGLLTLPLCLPGAWLAVWLFLLGACSGVLYPLGLALLSERVPEAGLPRAYAWYMAIECAGCVAGPVCMGQARDWFGGRAMFPAALLALGAVLLPWAARAAWRRRVPAAETPVVRKAA